jgi:hypothetical protein
MTEEGWMIGKGEPEIPKREVALPGDGERELGGIAGGRDHAWSVGELGPLRPMESLKMASCRGWPLVGME